MLDQGTDRYAVRALATMLLHIVRLMDLDCLRQVDIPEIERASLLWKSEARSYKGRQSGKTSCSSFVYMAVRFFKFHNAIEYGLMTIGPKEVIVGDFRHFLKETRGMPLDSVRGYCAKISSFLQFVEIGSENLSTVTLQEVDAFLQKKSDEGYRPRTIVSHCTALKMFFQYAEIRGLNNSRIAGGIQNPRIMRPDAAPKGPKWRDVRRLIDMPSSSKPSSLRAAAIMSLCSIYGMRSSEVVNFKLYDFDWVSEILIVVRAKGGRIQQFPIQFEVGETILRYLRYGRPRCTSKHLFVTLNPPYRPVRPSVVWGIVSDRMKSLGIDSEHFGGHALRHACATELLRKGTSLVDIADFLGHKTLNSVSVYAKYDLRSLRLVSNFSLAGVK